MLTKKKNSKYIQLYTTAIYNYNNSSSNTTTTTTINNNNKIIK